MQPCTRLNYLPPRASFITSSAYYPKKTKSQISVHVSRKESEVSNCKGMVFKLITSKEQIFANYSDLFDGIGCFPSPPYHIQFNPSVTPKQTPCQPIPIHPKESFKKEIDKMLQVRVLKPVKQATPWINSFVLVERKDNLRNLKLRICLDLTNLNKAIVCEPYHFKTPKDIAHLLAEACVCNCRKGHWHQQLDEASSFLTTFNTELGRFWYTVMPFGATVASDVFQRKLDECFGKLKEVIIIADDIMVVGYKPDYNDHNKAFTNLLQTVQECNVKLNYDKLQYKQNEANFFGNTYTTSGHKPARSKVSAITAMPSPTNKKQVQPFIGMIHYLSKFSPRLSELAEPIREFSKEKVPFNWGLEHQAAFTKMKQEISSASVLAYYNPKRQTMLQPNASIKRSWCLFVTKRKV